MNRVVIAFILSIISSPVLADGAIGPSGGSGSGSSAVSQLGYTPVGYLTPIDYGASTSAADNSTALNSWLAACATQHKVCYLPNPDGNPYIASSITFPAEQIMVQCSGVFFEAGGETPGTYHPQLKLKSGTNGNFITVTAGYAGSQPIIKDCLIDGNKANNTSGHTLYLPTDGGGGYGEGIYLDHVVLNNCATDCLNVEANRNNGQIVHSQLSHAANNGLTLAASDWRSDFSEYGHNVNYGISQTAGAQFELHAGAIYDNLIGYVLATNSVTPRVSIHGVQINDNQQNGVSINTTGVCEENQIIGNVFTNNSVASTGMYSDILLTNTGCTIVSLNSFPFVSTQSKYLLEANTVTVPLRVSNLSYDTTIGRVPYATDVTNLAKQVQLFVASGTWTAPLDNIYDELEIHACGQGGGGGGGAQIPSGTAASGGAGGGGGECHAIWLKFADAGTSQTVTIGNTDNHGAGATSTNTAGTDGTQGSNVTFGSLATWFGGGGGAGGQVAATASGGGAGGGITAQGASGAGATNGAANAFGCAGGSAGAGTSCSAGGGGGGGGVGTGAASNGGVGGYLWSGGGAGGGGSGAGITTGPAAATGGTGGRNGTSCVNSSAGGTAGNSANSVNADFTYHPGCGGGGGGSQLGQTGAPGNGAAGTGGAGGGGGGSVCSSGGSCTARNGGAGGQGGAGLMIVIARKFAVPAP